MSPRKQLNSRFAADVEYLHSTLRSLGFKLTGIQVEVDGAKNYTDTIRAVANLAAYQRVGLQPSRIDRTDVISAYAIGDVQVLVAKPHFASEADELVDMLKQVGAKDA